MAELMSVAPADLLIDEQNPRIAEPNAGQLKSLQALAGHLQAKLMFLARDIVEYGTDPSNLPIVMTQGPRTKRYVVLEGNRRLAALRVLENPESVADVVERYVLNELRKLSKEYQLNPIESLQCLSVKDRDEARHWIELRHTGENKGAGIVDWDADEAQKFRYRSKGELGEPHSQALDFLERRGDLTPEMRKEIPTSTLKRLIESPTVREKLGLEIQKRVLYLVGKESSVAKALMHIVDELRTGRVNVGDVYDAKKRAAYARDLPLNLVVKPTMKPGEGVSAAAAGASGSPKAPTPIKRARVRRKRDHLIPSDCILSISPGRIRDIETELRKMSLEDHTNGVSVLFRVFLELSLDEYNKKHVPTVTEDATLRKKMDAALKDLLAKQQLTKQQAEPVRRMLREDSFLEPSITLFNQYVHSPYTFPAAGDLRAHWDSLQPFFAAMWVI